MLLLVQRLASWLSASPQLRALSAAGRDAGVEEAVAARPLYSEVHVAGTERDGGELLRQGKSRSAILMDFDDMNKLRKATEVVGTGHQ